MESSGRSLEEVLGSLPVQEGGRIKPFESFARENVLMITGKTSFEKTSAALLVWRWIAKPDFWAAKSFIPVSDSKLREQFSSDLVKNRIAPSLVTADMNFLNHVKTAQMKQEKKEPLSPLEKNSLELYHKARLFEEISRGNIPGFIPHPGEPSTAWIPLAGILSAEGEAILKAFFDEAYIQKVRNSLSYLLGRLGEEDPRLAVASAEFFQAALNELLISRDIVLDESALHRELLYLKLKPFRLAWFLYLISVLLLVFGVQKRRKIQWTSLSFYVAGFLMHTYGFILRILISGRPPVTNMYESVIWVAWGVVLFSLILWFVYKSSLIPTVAASVAVLALVIGDSLPTVLSQSISPLVPVLRSNFWLTIHVLTITLGYGAFLLNWGISHVLLYHLAFQPSKKQEIQNLTEFLYRALQIGIILLAAGTILGGVWAAYSWGRFWGWDPKETWALIALLAYLALLHGRTAGWLDSFGVAFYSALCFLTVLMAWYGVNFVLAAGLHSYGFGGGGVQYVLMIVLTDVALLSFFRMRYKIMHAKGDRH
ncbi:MAG: cytochrome c biogenesis protein CcsA [Candidatus Omnitrophica bacterium]|nr:cytochrome c biogenesis protein CcsA [Candidatus Omnitrophota bacterium]